ncbi:MAG: NAD(P)-binding protein, partial [Gammaproteobacteria bacterium]|nr:NAD(P)-binding protein [Gammaproteobacteria bacterium]
MNIKAGDLTRSLDLTHERRSGIQRPQRPVYVDLLPPCNHACPAGENIQAWLAEAQAGRLKQAWEILVQDNPLPAVHGRVCYHPCESNCNRANIDSAVSIHAVERFLGDRANRRNWSIAVHKPATGKRILIIGAGPSGLSAAYHLRRLGHSVEIRDAGPAAGGMMRFGIPAYRLPRGDLAADIQRIEAMGVKIILNHTVEDLQAEREEGGFDAVFVAIGAHLSKRIDIPARDAGKIYDAVNLLHDVETGLAPKLGRRVAIYGGGNTAMDAARVAKRLGADEAMIIYRRDRAHMPAHAFEADEAIEEGVQMHWLRTIREMDVGAVKVEVMEIDADGRPQPTGRYENLEADSIILALGQNVDTGFLRRLPGLVFKDDGTIDVDQRMMTGAAGVFAGGDMVPSERTVTVAVGHGKKAARHIDAWLRGEDYVAALKHELAGFDKLHPWFITEIAQRSQPQVEPQDRRDFEEVVQGLTGRAAKFEAQRCLSCGNCFECDGCLGACPERAIIKLGTGKGYRVDDQRCTGCAICYEQ